MTVDEYRARFTEIESLFERTKDGIERAASRVPIHRMAEPNGPRLILAEKLRDNESRYRREMSDLETAWCRQFED